MRQERFEPERRVLNVDFSELEWAFEDQNEFGFGHWYLDRESGYVTRSSAEAAREAERLLMDLSEDEYADPNIIERLLEQATAFNCEEHELRDQLIIELSAPNRFISIDARPSYEAFKDVLIEFPEEQQQWFAFQNGRLRAHIVDFLHAEGIEPVAAEPGVRVELTLHGGS